MQKMGPRHQNLNEFANWLEVPGSYAYESREYSSSSFAGADCSYEFPLSVQREGTDCKATFVQSRLRGSLRTFGLLRHAD